MERYEILYGLGFGDNEEHLTEALKSQGWLAGVVCVTHTMCNGLTWGLARCKLLLVVNDMHLAVQSLRSNITHMHGHLAA